MFVCTLYTGNKRNTICQVNRVLSNAINTMKLRANNSLDTSSLLQQYNLNHMRTLNQLILVNMLVKQQKVLIHSYIHTVYTVPT